ncbi:MAG: M23 family metallopeptidase [Cryobacterium sp.]|nr:M23 family metallopeptidase [Micrococcales bacterium]MBX3308956.1 M23 family metallopeptidase [Cryobacterium sp.]
MKHRALKKLMTFGAMIAAGLMMVATTIPANAFYSSAAQSLAVAVPAKANLQSISLEPAAELTLTRDGYTATSLRDQNFLRYSSLTYFYTNDPTWSIQWPFPVAVPITDGFGPRVSPCSGCSTNHTGLDMLAGNGAPIGVIADGVVIGVNNQDWSYGQVVVVEHVINGQRVESWYAHMLPGSIQVNVGDQLKVGDQIGLVGSTGASTGSHLHLEIRPDGVAVDPFQWLKANAG